MKVTCKISVLSFLVLGIFLLSANAGNEQFLSYKVDGKEYRFSNVSFSYGKDDSSITIFADSKKSQFDRSEEDKATSGVSIGFNFKSGSVIGTYEFKTSAEVALGIWWPMEDGINEFYIFLPDDESSQLGFKLIIEQFGSEEGTVASGTFSGTLSTEDGDVKTVTDGKFRIFWEGQ